MGYRTPADCGLADTIRVVLLCKRQPRKGEEVQEHAQ